MKKLFGILISLSLAIVMLIPTLPVSAIQNGASDGTNHPYVCLVVFYDENDMPLWRTSGELLSPTVVLTAGHGTFGTAGARVWFLNSIPTSAQWHEGDPRPEAYPYGGPDSYSGTPDTIDTYRSAPAPGLPGFDYHDVGVVVLDSAVPTSVVSTYGALPAAGQADTFKMMTSVDLVGYGVTSQVRGGGITPADSWLWNRQRNFAEANLVQSKDTISSEFLKLTANPGKDKGGTTFGDSGGPILKDGTNIILGINAFVNNYNCDGVTYAQRIDLPDILTWINSFLD